MNWHGVPLPPAQKRAKVENDIQARRIAEQQSLIAKLRAAGIDVQGADCDSLWIPETTEEQTAIYVRIMEEHLNVHPITL